MLFSNEAALIKKITNIFWSGGTLALCNSCLLTETEGSQHLLDLERNFPPSEHNHRQPWSTFLSERNYPEHFKTVGGQGPDVQRLKVGGGTFDLLKCNIDQSYFMVQL